MKTTLLAATIMALASLPSHATGAPDTPPPNIILLMGDDHGWEETGYNGHPHLKTPALDAMAASGLRMDRFYSGHPSCSPTRGSVLTGRHPNRYGTFWPGCSLRPEEVTVAQLLRKAGYATAHFGKWHVGPVKAGSPTNPGAMGFDEWLSHDNFFELNPMLSRNGRPPEQFQGEGSEVIIDETIRFVDKAAKSGKLRTHLQEHDLRQNTLVWYCGDNGIPPDTDLLLGHSCRHSSWPGIRTGMTLLP